MLKLNAWRTENLILSAKVIEALCREGNWEICSHLNIYFKNANPISLRSGPHSLLADVNMQSFVELRELILNSVVFTIDNFITGKLNITSINVKFWRRCIKIFAFVLFLTLEIKLNTCEKCSLWHEWSGSQNIINGFQGAEKVVCPEQLLKCLLLIDDLALIWFQMSFYIRGWTWKI
jgi:hypothetical protein